MLITNMNYIKYSKIYYDSRSYCGFLHFLAVDNQREPSPVVLPTPRTTTCHLCPKPMKGIICICRYCDIHIIIIKVQLRTK